jgi:hypothetical protein
LITSGSSAYLGAHDSGKAIEKGAHDVGQLGRDIDRWRLELQSSVFTGPALGLMAPLSLLGRTDDVIEEFIDTLIAALALQPLSTFAQAPTKRRAASPFLSGGSGTLRGAISISLSGWRLLAAGLPLNL